MTVLEISAWASTTATYTTNISTTNYTWLGATALHWSGTESARQLKRNAAGTLSNLYVRISANTITATSTYRVRKNTANGNQVVSVTSSATGEFQDATHTDAIVATDLVNVSVVSGGTGTSIASPVIGCQFAATTNTAQCLAWYSSGAPAITTTQRFMVLGGGSDGTLATTEADAQYKFKGAGTLQALSIQINTNTANRTVTAVSRINTAAGNQTVSITSGLTGQFQDLTHTDTISSGTLACTGISVASGGSGTCTLGICYCEFVTTNSSFVALNSGITGATQGTSVTAYYPWMGYGLAPGSATESSIQIKAQNSYTVNNLAIFLRANSVSAASTLTLRKNAADATQTISITASTSGYFEDATHTDAVVGTDELNYKLLTGGTGTSMQIGSMGTLVSVATMVFRKTLSLLGTRVGTRQSN